MKLENGEYAVVCLDSDGYEVGSPTACDSAKDAKKRAKSLLGSNELKAAGMVKTEVRDSKGECVADYFV
jgi:hypothetical protein